MGFKVFQNNTTLTAEEVNDYLMEQSAIVFADATERANSLPTPQEGMLVYLQSTNELSIWNGSAWQVIGLSENPWTDLTLQNGWEWYGGGFASPRIRKTPDGIVVMEGLVRNGTADTITSVPAGYRPSGTLIMLSMGGGEVPVRINISTGGTVSLAAPYPTSWISLALSWGTA